MKLYRKAEFLINWIHQKLSPREFIVFSSVLVGLSASFTAVLLKTIVHYIHDFLQKSFLGQNYFYLAFPAIGILLTIYFVRRFLHNRLGGGTANICYAIIKKAAYLPKHLMFSHAITSALTVGFGGSAGLEAPIVTTGSALGSNYAKRYHLTYKDRVLLLACGAAAGIGAAFNAPVAGVLFALEVLMVDLTISAFIPLILAAAVGALASKIILQEGILLSFSQLKPFDYHNVPYYIMIGILSGFVSVYYSRAFLRTESFLHSTERTYKKGLWGGILLAVLILMFPPLFGEGYETIKNLSELHPEKLLDLSIFSGLAGNQWFVLLFVALVMFFKVIAASITINCGGNGGNFAPSLFVGAYLGFFFSRLVNLLGWHQLPENNMTVVAMSGILTGIYHAPLTATFLIAEITGGYDLMIPLMIVAALSYTVVKYFESHPMDMKKLVQQGFVISHDKDEAVLSSVNTLGMVEMDFLTVKSTANLGELVQVISKSRRNIFPVTDENENLKGIIQLDNIREIIFRTELYDKIHVNDLMQEPPAIIEVKESMQEVMKKFDSTQAWNLPVVNQGQYMGFISKSSIFTTYRTVLQKRSIS